MIAGASSTLLILGSCFEAFASEFPDRTTLPDAVIKMHSAAMEEIGPWAQGLTIGT